MAGGELSADSSHEQRLCCRSCIIPSSRIRQPVSHGDGPGSQHGSCDCLDSLRNWSVRLSHQVAVWCGRLYSPMKHKFELSDVQFLIIIGMGGPRAGIAPQATTNACRASSPSGKTAKAVGLPDRVQLERRSLGIPVATIGGGAAPPVVPRVESFSVAVPTHV